MKKAKNNAKPDKNTRAKSSKGETKASNLEKAKRINRILLTIIVTAITVIVILNISQLFQLQSKADKAQAKDSSNIIINNNLQDDESNKDTIINDANEAKSSDDVLEEVADAKQEDDVAKDEQTIKDEVQDAPTSLLTVYFVKILDNGQISILPSTREVPKTLAILTQTMNELLQGPTETEAATGLVHFIPSGSKLNKISLKNGVAYLDFNETFQLNEYGSAGILAQLYQVIYTCTELASIHSVKITINNATVKYLGGEGNIEIDFPLTRDYLDSL